MADKRIDLIKIHCINSDLDICEQCPREFCISVNSIKMILKNGGGNATFDTGDHYTHHYLCGPKLRTIKTGVPYLELLSSLSLNIHDIGDVEMVYYKNTVGID